jgi:hypothetical protein
MSLLAFLYIDAVALLIVLTDLGTGWTQTLLGMLTTLGGLAALWIRGTQNAKQIQLNAKIEADRVREVAKLEADKLKAASDAQIAITKAETELVATKLKLSVEMRQKQYLETTRQVAKDASDQRKQLLTKLEENTDLTLRVVDKTDAAAESVNNMQVWKADMDRWRNDMDSKFSIIQDNIINRIAELQRALQQPKQ